MQIKNKQEFFKLWKAGALGNRTNLWTDPSEAYASGVEEIGFRQIGKSGGGAWERVHRSDVFTTAERWRSAGRMFVMDDGCPDHRRTLQGEICRTYRGLEGFLDIGAKLAMRPGIAAGHFKPYSGAAIIALLNYYMDPSSIDDLYGLLDLYPDATVEFTTFSCDVGVYPNRNTIFWETRNY